jgi:Zn-dependent protease with chaperone function
MESEILPLTSDLIGLLSEIRDEIARSSADSLVSALFVTVVGAFSGAFAAYFFSRIMKKQSQSAVAAKRLCDLIDSLEDVASKYWLSGSDDTVRRQLELQEIQMKSLHKLIRRYVRLLKTSKIDDEIAKKLDVFTTLIFNVATGGEFESRERQSSYKTASQVASICADARVDLSEISLSAFG